MNKRQRNYKLVYTAPPSEAYDQPIAITIQYPIGLELDVKRDTLATSNRASFRLYNLSKNNRELMFQDMFNINRYCFIELYAGYGDNMPLIFSGKVMQAYSGRSGTEVITEIEALDNDIIQSYSSYTFEAGTPKKDVLNRLMQDMPNTQVGAIGTLEGNLLTRTVFDERTFTAINKLTGNRVFIDNGKLNLLSDNECLGDIGIYKITSATGLIGTPRRRDVVLEMDLIFAPEITVGQLVDIDDPILTEFNGQFKVLGVHHHGVINDQVGGELITTLTVGVGSLLPNSNYISTGASTYQPVSVVVNNMVQQLGDEAVHSIREVYNYMMKNNKLPHTKLTKNIWWDEVVINFNKQGSKPGLYILTNLYKVANELQKVLDQFYPNSKVKITSGWRSPSYNSNPSLMGGKKGASNSAHLVGMALDFQMPNQVLSKAYNNLRKVWPYRGRYYLGGGWIHVDIATDRGKIVNDK